MKNRRWIVFAAAILPACRALAVAYNTTSPTFSATTTAAGFTDALTLFVNENVITNSSNSTRGTGTYLGNGWVLTAQHVIQNGSDYNTLASPSQLTMSVGAGGVNKTYTADMVSTEGSPAGGPDIAMIHLAGFGSGPLATLPGVLKSAIYTGGSETNQLVQLGGFGWYGPLGSATLSEDASFHRAFNVVASLSGDKANVPANASSRLVSDGYVLGIGEPGDSGSGLWMDTGPDSDTNLWDYKLIGALDTTSNGAAFGSSNQYSRVSSHSAWILNTAYAAHTTVTWDASPATADIQDGSGTWDLATANFGDGSDNFAWDDSTVQNANFGAHKGAAGTVTLGANISVQNVIFDPALSGNYVIASSSGFVLTVASGGIITSRADATIAATIAGSGTLNKLGPNVLTLSGSNTFTGTLTVGDGATSGDNLNGALRITTGNALAHISDLVFPDNNSAHATLQIDGSAGDVVVASSTALIWNANNDGPAATAGNIIENIAGDNTVNSPVTYQVGGIGYGIASDSGTLTLAGNFNANGTSGKTFYLRGAGNGAISGILNGSGGNIVLSGSGVWTLNSANTINGVTTIAGGVLSTSRLANGGAASGIGESSNAAANLIFSGGTLRYTGAGANIDRLFTIGPGGGSLDASGSGTLALSRIGAAATSDAAVRNGTTVSGSNTVTVTSGGMVDLVPGEPITGSGIPTGTTIASVNPDTGTIALSNSAMLSASAAISFGAVNRVLALTGANTGSNTLAASLANSTGGGRLGITKSGDGAWTLSGVSTFTGDTNITDGTLTLATGASIASPNIAVSSGATLNVNGAVSNATALTSNGITHFAANAGITGPAPRTLTSIALGSTGSVTIASSASHANRTVLSVATLSFAGTSTAPLGSLDLADNDLIATSTPLSTIQNDITSAYNSGAWNGQGLTSSNAASIAMQANPANHATALGYAIASSVNAMNFDGQSIGGSTVLVKYTLAGDSNLDGIVNAQDFDALAADYGVTSNGIWSGGDFNYDGTVNTTDFNLLAANFNATPLSSAALGSLVPEPTCLCAIALIFLHRRARPFPGRAGR